MMLCTSLIFNKLAYLLGMVYAAVVNDKDTAWCRIGVGERNLYSN